MIGQSVNFDVGHGRGNDATETGSFLIRETYSQSTKNFHL